jgi:murein DD-endopeptidase MepM/ murein hydrolase activator NlpD
VYRFAPPGREPGWFDGDGRSIKRALLRTPVDAARVSSNFGFRIHPILGYAKLHRGTDFAHPPARRSTPAATAWWSGRR